MKLSRATNELLKAVGALEAARFRVESLVEVVRAAEAKAVRFKTVCASCGPLRPSGRDPACQACREKRQAIWRAAYWHKAKLLPPRLCSCGRPAYKGTGPPVCRTCLDQRRALRRTRHCARCGAVVQIPRKRLCVECVHRQRQRQLELKRQRYHGLSPDDRARVIRREIDRIRLKRLNPEYSARERKEVRERMRRLRERRRAA